MKLIPQAQLPHRLVRATVTSPPGQTSVRYIEHNLFDLWQAHMGIVHGINVVHATPCVWAAKSFHQQCPDLGKISPHLPFKSQICQLAFTAKEDLSLQQMRYVDNEDINWLTPLLTRRVFSNQPGLTFDLEVKRGEVYSTSPLAA